jgi:hypothetical protein
MKFKRMRWAEHLPRTGRRETNIESQLENLVGRSYSEDLDVDGVIIKFTSKKNDVRV